MRGVFFLLEFCPPLLTLHLCPPVRPYQSCEDLAVVAAEMDISPEALQEIAVSLLLGEKQ